LISQVLLYPGLEELIDALGVETSLQAGMWFLVAEFTAFVLFAGVWGAISDTTGKRRRWIMLGSSGGALAYITLIVVAPYSIPFAAILAIRVLGGAFTIGAFSLGMTMLMDLTGGSGRNMGAAGIAIGLGAALGSVIGGQLTAVNPLGRLC
jgi:MFS family permease